MTSTVPAALNTLIEPAAGRPTVTWFGVAPCLATQSRFAAPRLRDVRRVDGKMTYSSRVHDCHVGDYTGRALRNRAVSVRPDNGKRDDLARSPRFRVVTELASRPGVEQSTWCNRDEG